MSDTKNENTADLSSQKLVEPNPVPKSERRYAILQETSGEECESWLYFIKYQGNEEVLHHLLKQLESVEWYIVDDLSTFDLELDYLVSEQTAKEMSKVDLNHHSFHRKFDGTMKKIDLKLKASYTNGKKISKIFDVLGYGQIEDYVSDEDIDPEDMPGDDESETESEEEETEEESGSESEESSESESSESEEEKQPKRHARLPSVLRTSFARDVRAETQQEIPRIAKIKQRHKKK